MSKDRNFLGEKSSEDKWDMTQDGHKCVECPPLNKLLQSTYLSKRKTREKRTAFWGENHLLKIIFFVGEVIRFELRVCLIQHGSLLPS